jgi:thiosulfate dehydrogenase [quinone] large subunit
VNTIQDPPIARFLFSDTRIAIVWLLVRLYVGYEWLEAGYHKITQADGGWMQTGNSLLGFWKGIVVVPQTGSPKIAFDWYRNFIQFLIDTGSYTWFAKLVAVGEFLVGVGLILGAFVGIAAFFGALMNFNFMLAGSASTNPVLFFLAVLLMLAWKVAGYYGLDRYLLGILGTPWQPTRQVVAKPVPSAS